MLCRSDPDPHVQAMAQGRQEFQRCADWDFCVTAFLPEGPGLCGPSGVPESPAPPSPNRDILLLPLRASATLFPHPDSSLGVTPHSEGPTAATSDAPRGLGGLLALPTLSFRHQHGLPRGWARVGGGFQAGDPPQSRSLEERHSTWGYWELGKGRGRQQGPWGSICVQRPLGSLSCCELAKTGWCTRYWVGH